MAKLNARSGVKYQPRGPVASEPLPSGKTHEGAEGYARDDRSELFLMAVGAFANESTFYEARAAREDRARELAGRLACADPAWLLGFTQWLRQTANMRTASVMITADAIHARLAAGLTPADRSMIPKVLARADEPGELLAYWRSRYGRKIPKPVKRGVADAAVKLYNERSLLKYDTPSHGYQFGDVIEICHAKPKAAWQSELFKYAIDRRHGRAGEITGLKTIDAHMWMGVQALGDNPAALLDAAAVDRAGMTWEDVLSLGGSKLPKLDLWRSVLPSMGYMALLRNLRNLDDAGLPDDEASAVMGRLVDTAAVARSRQLPFRFWSAWKAVASLRWGPALEAALNLSLGNVPQLPGRTLVLVDCSGSMANPMSGKSKMSMREAAVLFGCSLAVRAQAADLVAFGTASKPVRFGHGASVLRLAEQFGDMGGTQTAEAVRRHYNGHERVVIITDEQAWASVYGNPLEQIPAAVPSYTWNLAGYGRGHGPDKPGRYTLGGLSDASFALIPLLERGEDAPWPWLTD